MQYLKIILNWRKMFLIVMKIINAKKKKILKLVMASYFLMHSIFINLVLYMFLTGFVRFTHVVCECDCS